jgi:hypothetical protein
LQYIKSGVANSAQHGYSPYQFAGNNPILNIDKKGEYAINVHYNYVSAVLTLLNYDLLTTKIIAHYASVYADNPAPFIQNLYGLYKEEGIDYHKTLTSQFPFSKEASMWHSMRAEGEDISNADALKRGQEFGWSKIIEAGKNAFIAGGIDKLKKNSPGMEALGQGIHALQDALVHMGVGPEGHSIQKDVFLNSEEDIKLFETTKNVIIVTEIISGNYSNLKSGMTINLTGTSDKQFEEISKVIQGAVEATKSTDVSIVRDKEEETK